MLYNRRNLINQVSSVSLCWSWISAFRPRTLPISLVPVLIATSMAKMQLLQLNWILVLMASMCSLCIQIGTNLINDALDGKTGADGVDRLGPKRVTQAGLIPFRNVLNAGYLSFIMGAIFGIPLMTTGGWPLVVVILLSIACGYFYTGGPYPLSYTGFSDFFILLFFGWISTMSIYYVLVGKIDAQCLLAATQVGLLAIVPHAINNLRDHVADAKVKKRTLVVRFGVTFARIEITILSLLPFVLGLLWISYGKIMMTLLPVAAFPLIITNIYAIWNTQISISYNNFLSKSALCQLIFSLLLSLGSFLSMSL